MESNFEEAKENLKLLDDDENPELKVFGDVAIDDRRQTTDDKTPEPEIAPNVFKDGRHKKSCMCADCIKKRSGPHEQTTDNRQQTTETKSENPELDDWAKGEERPETTPPPVDISEYVSGAMFIMFLEQAFPFILKYIGGFFEPKYKRINQKGKDKLKLTESEFEELEEMADKLAKMIFAEMPAWLGFCILYGMMKLFKTDDLTDDCFDPAPEKK